MRWYVVLGDQRTYPTPVLISIKLRYIEQSFTIRVTFLNSSMWLHSMKLLYIHFNMPACMCILAYGMCVLYACMSICMYVVSMYMWIASGQKMRGKVGI